MAAQFLPASLQERLRPQHGATLPAPRDAGPHVLYCMRTAYRSAANPSLETALRVANELRVPLLCLAVLEDSFPAALSRIGMRPPDRATAFVERLLAEMAAEGWENDFSPQMEAGRTLDFYWRPLDGIDPDDQRDDIAVGVIRNDDTHLIMLSHGMRTLPGTDTE